MKKIILIDDNSKNQRVSYGASFVDENLYEDVLFHIEKLSSLCDLSFLDDAVCIMMHDSLEDFIDGEFVSSSHKAKERIEDIIQEKNIPYVLFSDGHAISAEWREETPNVVYSIKKSEFYRHLSSFISNYKSTGAVDMRIIAFGKDFMKDLLCQWCLSVISSISALKDFDSIDLSYIDKKKMRLIIENSQPKIGVDFNELMCDIEDGNITAGNLRANMNNIISSVKKYGKNISSWK